MKSIVGTVIKETGLVIAGFFVLILGITVLFGSIGLFFQFFWPSVLILIDLWILLCGLKLNRRYNQQLPK